MKNKAKKYVASVSLVALFGIYSIYQNLPDNSSATYAAAPVSYNAPVTKSSTGQLAIAETTTTTPARTISSPTKRSSPSTVHRVSPLASSYKDGVYTGISADAYYGNVQVQITVQGGVVTDVTAIQSPDTHSRSLAINSRALPMLRSEAITAQNARINAVSGATYTSAAYKESIASALSQATA